MARSATMSRSTAETTITATWNLDAEGSDISTGIGFFDHMLEALAKHSGTRLEVHCAGDIQVDGHHTTEDVGIVLGQCLKQALGDRSGVERYGHIGCPLDEALVIATVDLSGRGLCVCNVHPPAPMIGAWDTELVPEFFAALAGNGGITLHLHQQCGRNSHHIVEATFKACARALRQAIAITGSGIPSTKGSLAG